MSFQFPAIAGEIASTIIAWTL